VRSRSSGEEKPIERAAASLAYTTRPLRSCAVMASATAPSMTWSSSRAECCSRSASSIPVRSAAIHTAKPPPTATTTSPNPSSVVLSLPLVSATASASASATAATATVVRGVLRAAANSGPTMNSSTGRMRPPRASASTASADMTASATAAIQRS
jgi:hypothetical protein